MAGGLAAINGQWIMYGDLSADDGTMSLIQSSGQPYVRIILRKPSTDTLFTVGSNATLTVGVALYADKDYIGSATLGFCKQGAGTLLLTAANPYAGSTTISEGTLKIGDGGTAGTLGQGAVTNNASLVFNRTDNYGGDIGNLISGTGSLTVASGTLALAGANTYSGATLVSNGVLRLTQTQCLATNTAVAIASGGMIDLAFTGVTTVRSLTINGVLQTRNRLFSRANRSAALSGDGFFLATEGAAPKGTLITIF
jgi:autotransporter-associated beta strand protein